MGIVERAPDEMSIPGQSDVDGDVDHGPEAPNLFNDWKTFSRGGAAALRSNSSVAALFTAHDLDLPLHQEDGFRAWDHVKGTDLEPYRERFLGIRNSEAFTRRVAQIRAEQKDRKFLDALPWWQRMLIEGAAGQADWTSIPLFGTLVRAANGGFSLAKTAAAGASANFGSSVVQEGMLHSIQSTRELDDSAMAIGGSALLGGLIGFGSAAAMNKLMRHGAARALERDADLAPARKVFADIERKLIDAGVPEAEARRAAAVDANRYHARAKRMNESDGNAWKMYQDDNGGGVAQPKSDIERVLPGAAEPAEKSEIEKRLHGAAEPAAKPEIERPPQGAGEPAARPEIEKPWQGPAESAAKSDIEKPPQGNGAEPAPKSEIEKLLHGDARGENGPAAPGPRGPIEMSPARDEISLFKDADGPTFMRQTGRMWLADLASDATRAGAPQGLKDNAAEVLKWLGVKRTDDIGTVQHGAWAQGFDRYLAEGKAPNPALAEAFEKYKQWLVEVHRSLTQTGAPISGEVRGVMGRMLAADGDPGFTPVAIGGRRAGSTRAGNQSDFDSSETAAGGNTSGSVRETAAARAADDVADNPVTTGAPDSGLSSPYGVRGEQPAARAEGLRPETDTGRGTDSASAREIITADAGPPRSGDPPDGTSSIIKSEEAVPGAASSLREPGPDAPGVGVAPGNMHGVAPGLRVVVTEQIDDPTKQLFTQETTNKNAARQIDNLDVVHAADPDPERDAAAWSRMMAHALGSNDVPIPPYGLLRDIHGGGAVETLKKLTPDQRAAADFGVEQGRAYREAYTKGEVNVETTGRLLLWSFLSRGRSPYVQESMFIDASKEIGPWIAKAAEGRFTKADLAAYEAWAKSAAPRGSGQPGARATGNLIKFGREFLIRMSAKDESGMTHLQRFHDMLSDPNMTGRQIRREFLKFGEATGIDNKVVSFTLLVAGHNDVMVLDRVQVRALFDDGRFKRRDMDVYAGIGHNSRRYGGNGLVRLTVGARGLLVYEAIERALERRVKDIYAAAGRPQDASIGRYQWETWQVHSGQEASHGTLAAVFDESAIAKVRAVEGEYGAFAHGARYGLDEDGKPIFIYRLPSGEEYASTPPAFQALMTAISDPSSGVVPRGFKVTESGNVPWYERPEVSKQRLEELVRQHSDLGRISGAGPNGEVRGGEEAGGTVLRRRSEWEVGDADGSGPGGVVLRRERESPGGGDRRGGLPSLGSAGRGEEVKFAGPPPRPAGPSDGTTAIPDPTKAADQAASSYPEQAAPSGDPPNTGGKVGKVRSVAAASLAAAGLAAAGMSESGGDTGDDPIAARIIESLRRLNRRRFEDIGFDASAETLMKDWNGGLKRALKGTKAAFTEHWKAAGALDEREFYEDVGRALRNDGEADDPQVARAAKLWRSDVFGPITEAAVKAGLLPGDVHPAEAVSYFSRLWSRGKLFAMEAEFKVTAAEFYAGRMAKEARRERERGSAADVRAAAREIADDLFDALTGRADGGSRPEFAGAHIPDALAAPFLEDDVERVGRSFVRTMGADLELAQNFGTPDLGEALQEVRAGYARRRAEVAGENERRALDDAEKRDIADLVALRDRVRGHRIEGTIEHNYARIVRAASHLDAIRATGEVRLPSLPDAIRPAMVEGLSAYMQTAGRLATELEAVTLPQGEAALATKVTERVLAHRLSQLAGLDDPYAAKPPPDAFLAAMTDPASQGNGARIFADMVKSFTAVMVQDRILHGVRDFANLEPGQRALLRDLGIDQDVAQQIAGQFARHGEEVEGVNVANTAAWDKDDPTTRALRAFRVAVNKDTLFAATPAGEAMRAFKNFALASYQRLLLRVLDAKAERFMGGLIAMTTMGMFAAFMASRGVAQDAERWIGEGFERSGIMAVPLELSDAFEKATGFDPLGPLNSPESGTRLLPFNAYPGIRQMLGYALHPHN